MSVAPPGARGGTIYSRAVSASLYQQRDQPNGVPPLALTGERTLPDVPEENYWFRRHLVVYQWIAARVGGLRVIDMACGEGYGSDVLAGSAASVVGVDANPEAHEHARARYRRANLRFERDLIETFSEPADAVVFLQTVEHLQDPGAALEHFRALVAGAGGGSGGTVYLSTPNVLTLAPKGAERSDNPWHVHEYRAHEFERLCREHFASVALFGLFHARRLRAHELALRLGWDSVHPRLGLTERFYGWFTPAISVSDFALRPRGQADLERALDFVAVCRREPPSGCPPAPRRAGDRPAHPHALRGGLRDVAVRGGVAVGGARHVLPAAAGAAGGRGAADGVADPGALRPTGGSGGGGAVRAVRGGHPPLHPRRGRPGVARGWPRDLGARAGARLGGLRARPRELRAPRRGPAGRTRPVRPLDLLGHPRSAPRCSPRRRGCGCRPRPVSSLTARASARAGGGASGCRSAPTPPTWSPRWRRPGCTPLASS